MEERVTADLTETERKHLLSALEKIHRAATDLLGGRSDSDKLMSTSSMAQPE